MTKGLNRAAPRRFCSSLVTANQREVTEGGRRAQFPAGLPNVGPKLEPLVPVVGPLPVGWAPSPVSLGTMSPLRFEGAGVGRPPSTGTD
jgi:hypothetical protein